MIKGLIVPPGSRRALTTGKLLGAALVVLSCSKTVHEVTPPVPAPGVSDVELSIYLIGDAGAPAVGGEPVLRLNDGGQVTCLNAEDGEELWYERVTGEAYASPLLVDGKLYCFSRKGEMVVLAAKDELEELGRHDFGEGIFATPAIADGRMYVRTFNRLISVGGAK